MKTLCSTSLRSALCLLVFGSLPSVLCGQGGFTNSATLSAAVSGTNLVISYSLTTTQGWVTLFSADGLGALAANSQFVDFAPVLPSRLGQFVVPVDRLAPAKFYRLLLEEWPSRLINFPDLSVIVPAGEISIVGTGTSREFRYTHDTFNGGTGPLEIQPVYNPASGNYQGYQHLYYYQSGTWALVRNVPVAAAFGYHPNHGHFHFPFASFGLYSVNPDDSIGAPVALSPKTGFCIADSFIYDPSLPNAGAFGNWGSCSDPISLRGLSIGAVDEYDQSDPGQSIPIPGLPDGTYWLRAMADPDNHLAESDESNNATDLKLTISGNSVTILQTVQPVLPPPPPISLTSPSAGNISGTVQLAASASAAGVSGVQFLIDGYPYGSVVATPPYTLAWNTTAVPDGTHWLAAQTTDSAGRTGTSPTVLATVNNGSTVPPTVQLTSPDPGSTVSAVVTVGATATAQSGQPSVQFYVDGVVLGAPVTAPPFMTTWDTLRATPGPHTLTAVASDLFGLVGSSTPVSVTVDNSHPPNLIGIDVMVFSDTSDVMQTPAFSTGSASDLLVAFVAYDGPPGGPQTGTVSGAGLPWQLVKRSNAQFGTSEIWAAKATNLLSSVTVTSQPGRAGYHGSLTVIAFTNASGPGIVGQASAPSGPPDIYLPGILAGNWVFAVGNDWDAAVARIPVSGQTLIHQRVDTQVGDTFWVQATAAPSTVDGLVDIHDTAPTNDQWNYAAVEIVATRQ
jgi:hypothetical protein